MPTLNKIERAQAIMSYLARNPNLKHTINTLSLDLRLPVSSVRRSITVDYPRTFTERKTPPYGFTLAEPIVWPDEIEFDLYSGSTLTQSQEISVEDITSPTPDRVMLEQMHDAIMNIQRLLIAALTNDTLELAAKPVTKRQKKNLAQHRYPAWIDEDHPQSVTSGKPITMEAAKIRFETYPDNPEYRRPGTRSTNNREAVNHGSEG